LTLIWIIFPAKSSSSLAFKARLALTALIFTASLLPPVDLGDGPRNPAPRNVSGAELAVILGQVADGLPDQALSFPLAQAFERVGRLVLDGLLDREPCSADRSAVCSMDTAWSWCLLLRLSL